MQTIVDNIGLNSKKLPKILLVPAKYAQSNAKESAYNELIEIDFATLPDISFDSSTMLSGRPRLFISSTVKHDVLYATRNANSVIAMVHFKPSLAAEIGNDISPEPIAVPETKKTEFTNLLITNTPNKNHLHIGIQTTSKFIKLFFGAQRHHFFRNAHETTFTPFEQTM